MPIGGKEAIRILEKQGFTISRQRGSHIVLVRNGKTTVVPMHKELKKGTIRSIAKLAGLDKSLFGL